MLDLHPRLNSTRENFAIGKVKHLIFSHRWAAGLFG